MALQSARPPALVLGRFPVRTEQRNTSRGAGTLSRQEARLVLQKYHARKRKPFSQRIVFRPTSRRLRCFSIEGLRCALGQALHPLKTGVQVLLFHCALRQRLRQLGPAHLRGPGHLDIEPRKHGPYGFIGAPPVGHHNPIKAPALPQDLRQ